MSIKRPIYLDNNATTPIDPRVTEAMLPFLREEFGNPSSKSHAYGWNASAAVEKARRQVAQVVGAQPKEVYFTSGATESNNIAILGLMQKWLGERPHLITSNVEHKAVLEVCKAAEELGAELTVLSANSEGIITADQVDQAIRPNTKLISLMAANNEIGSLNPLHEIAFVAQRRKVLFHTDAAQGYGKIPLNMHDIGIDLLSLSGHKIYGPKGTGALIINAKNTEAMPKPIFFGGSQESQLRPGTLNVSGLVGLGEAAEICGREMKSEVTKLQAWQEEIIVQVLESVACARLNGPRKHRLCNNVSFSFDKMSADLFALGLSGLALSSGSACNSGDPSSSHVLKAIGHSDALAKATLRIGLGRFTTEQDVATVIQKICALDKKNIDISGG